MFQEPIISVNPVRSIGSQIMESIKENLDLSRSAARVRAIALDGSIQAQIINLLEKLRV
ncbi:hypothetical protein [Maliponia aquimaris]|uniref:hypothetical protein n=1 Tax=Maliponia aquimaris TaxID=1673631 RepID=UPI0015957885|nr:hypothetical protein [Maliponia aquimaris]